MSHDKFNRPWDCLLEPANQDTSKFPTDRCDKHWCRIRDASFQSHKLTKHAFGSARFAGWNELKLLGLGYCGKYTTHSLLRLHLWRSHSENRQELPKHSNVGSCLVIYVVKRGSFTHWPYVCSRLWNVFSYVTTSDVLRVAIEAELVSSSW